MLPYFVLNDWWTKKHMRDTYSSGVVAIAIFALGKLLRKFSQKARALSGTASQTTKWDSVWRAYCFENRL